MENVPGGDMEELATLSYDADRKRFLRTVLDKLEKHHPTTYDRIDTARFDPAAVRPELVDALAELLNYGVTPVVPRYGSVGASGDLMPSAYIARVLLGEGGEREGA